MASNEMKIAVVGGGLAGLAAAMKIAEAGYAVDLFSVVPVKRSHSVCAQGGINGAVNLGYSIGDYQLTVPVGEASLYHSGLQEAVWFKGVQGSESNMFAGTILEDFQTGPGTAIEGHVYRDGRFSVSTTSSYKFMSLDAALTLTVTNDAISARGLFP